RAGARPRLPRAPRRARSRLTEHIPGTAARRRTSSQATVLSLPPRSPHEWLTRRSTLPLVDVFRTDHPTTFVASCPGLAWTKTLALGRKALAPAATPLNEIAKATAATETAPAATNLRDTDMCSTSSLRLQKTERVSATPLTRR